MITDAAKNRCLRCAHGGKPVPGEGPQQADVMLIGQNPGAEEARVGRPFVGRSGKYLNEVLRKNGIRRESLFITGLVKCQTPHNRKPNAEEIRNCIPFLVEQIQRIKPKVIVLMGEVAWKTPRLEGIRYIETYHPAAAMRFPKVRKIFEEDFRRLSQDEISVSGDQG